MSVVALIPARGGSKGIPKKNLVQICGQPLIAYSIDAACRAESIDRVIVSTDDAEIANVARDLGAEVPFLRPTALAVDTAPMLGVLRHAVEWLDGENGSLKALVLLQPTSPLRTSVHIEEAVALFKSSTATSVVSVVEVPHQFNPYSIMTLSAQGTLKQILGEHSSITRRQDKPKCYARNGPAVLVCSPNTLRAGALYGECSLPYIMSPHDSLDIDNWSDIEEASQHLKRRFEERFSE